MVEFEENCRKAFDHLVGNQEKVEGKSDKKAHAMIFKKRDMVLTWDRRHEKQDKHGKFDILWLGPYKIEGVAGLNSFYFSHLDGEKLPLLVNGQLLKIYYSDGI